MINDKISNSNSQEILCTLSELRVLAENVAQGLLRSKSKKDYEAVYEKFVQWEKKTTRQLHQKLPSRLLLPND